MVVVVVVLSPLQLVGVGGQERVGWITQIPRHCSTPLNMALRWAVAEEYICSAKVGRRREEERGERRDRRRKGGNCNWMKDFGGRRLPIPITTITTTIAMTTLAY